MKSDKETIKFSIIIPVFNVEKYIEKCVRSLLQQDYNNFEIILVDDGSQDLSGKIADLLSIEDSRIRSIHKKNGGLVSARKYGCSFATGDYVMCVDSDDIIIDFNYLTKIFDVLVSNKCPDLLCVGFQKVDESDKNIGAPVLNSVEPRLYINNDLNELKESFIYSNRINGFNFGKILFSIWTKIIKRDIYIDCQRKVIDPVKYGEDLLVVLYILNMVTSVVVSNLCGYGYRINNNSMMRTLDVNVLKKYETTINEMTNAGVERNKIRVYCIGILSNCVFHFANCAKDYKQFKLICKNYLFLSTVWNEAVAGKYKKRFKDHVRDYFIKNKNYFLLYIFYKKTVRREL